MHKSIQEWMQDPEFVLHISICQQLGEPALEQAMRRFKSELIPALADWKKAESLSAEDKLVVVRKVKMSSVYIGAKRLHQLALSLEQPLAAGMDQPLDPMMQCLSDFLDKFENI